MAVSAEGISSWAKLFDDLRKSRAERPYIQDIAKANRDLNVSKADSSLAEALFAPQYYKGRADVQTNDAGLKGVELQYAPEKSSLVNSLLRAQIGSANRSNQDVRDRFSSPFGKLQADYARIVEQYGADSPQAAEFHDYINSQIKPTTQIQPFSNFGKLQSDYEQIIKNYGQDSPQAKQFSDFMQSQIKQPNNGILVGTDENGRPIVKIGGSGKGGSGMGGGLGLNPATGDITSLPSRQRTTLEQASIGSNDDITRYIEDAIKVLPQFQGPSARASILGQGLANKYLGAQFEGPSKRIEGQAAIKKTVDKFIASANLPRVESSTQLVKDIFEPRVEESESGYRNRLTKELNDLAKTHRNAQKRLREGYKVGNIQGNSASSGDRVSQLKAMAQDAISKGADPNLVNQRLQQQLAGK